MGAKEAILFGLGGVVSGTADTVHGVCNRNSHEVNSGIGALLGGGFGIALGLTVGAVQLGAKAVKAGIKAAKGNQQE